MKAKITAFLLVLTLLMSLCACNEKATAENATSSNEEISSEPESNTEEETENPEVDCIDLEYENGSIKFTGYEYVNKSFYKGIDGADYKKTILINFDFVNKQAKPAGIQNAFGITVYQNGVELDWPQSRNGDIKLKSLDNYFATSMKDSVCPVALPVVLQDYSDISIMVTAYNKDRDYQIMNVSIDQPGSSSSNSSISSSAQPLPQTIKLHAGDTITTDDISFTLNKVELTYHLKPKNTSGYYWSFPADDDCVYIHIDATVTNTSKQTMYIEDLPVPTADFDNGYTYTGFVVIDDGDSNFSQFTSDTACDPLKSCHYHGLINCPELVDTSSAPLFVEFTLDDGNTYHYDIR